MRKKEKALLMQGGKKTVSRQLKRSKMVILPKAKSQLNQKNAIATFLSAAKRSFFIGYASSVKIKSERKIISSSPTKGFINSAVRIRSPGRTSGTPE